MTKCCPFLSSSPPSLPPSLPHLEHKEEIPDNENFVPSCPLGPHGFTQDFDSLGCPELGARSLEVEAAEEGGKDVIEEGVEGGREEGEGGGGGGEGLEEPEGGVLMVSE